MPSKQVYLIGNGGAQTSCGVFNLCCKQIRHCRIKVRESLRSSSVQNPLPHRLEYLLRIDVTRRLHAGYSDVRGRDIFKETQTRFRLDRLLHAATGIAPETFRIAGENFERLAVWITKALQSYQGQHLASLQECSEPLSLLPNVPEHEKQSRNQEGRQRQQKLVKRKKPEK